MPKHPVKVVCWSCDVLSIWLPGALDPGYLEASVTLLQRISTFVREQQPGLSQSWSCRGGFESREFMPVFVNRLIVTVMYWKLCSIRVAVPRSCCVFWHVLHDNQLPDSDQGHAEGVALGGVCKILARLEAIVKGHNRNTICGRHKRN
jgi:hypothetical protein